MHSTCRTTTIQHLKKWIFVLLNELARPRTQWTISCATAETAGWRRNIAIAVLLKWSSLLMERVVPTLSTSAGQMSASERPLSGTVMALPLTDWDLGEERGHLERLQPHPRRSHNGHGCATFHGFAKRQRRTITFTSASAVFGRAVLCMPEHMGGLNPSMFVFPAKITRHKWINGAQMPCRRSVESLQP
eukprot:351361-Chlamydomonas_euryale.AAC.11